MNKLNKKIKISTTLEILTGLHIGGSSDSVEIGGIDNPVIKIATQKNQPYIPGSSLKGKIRCLLEQIEGVPLGKSDEINRLFGVATKEQSICSKLIVRDAYLEKDSYEKLDKCENLDMPFTEAKWENSIDRVKGTAENPRQMERIPAGAIFNVEFLISIWDEDNEEEFVTLLEKGIKALENDYLGGSGTRGYGQIAFGELKKENIPL